MTAEAGARAVVAGAEIKSRSSSPRIDDQRVGALVVARIAGQDGQPMAERRRCDDQATAQEEAMPTIENYPLGYSQTEAQRLADQAAFLEDLTEDLLRRAGLCSGMRVLDVGCGVGDVSFLAARLVGEDGVVLGVDRAPCGGTLHSHLV
jgi:hypothetical protein